MPHWRSYAFDWAKLGFLGMVPAAAAADQPSKGPHLISSQMLQDFQTEVSVWLHKVYQAAWVEQPRVVFDLASFILGFSSVTLIFVLLLRQYVFNASKEAGRSPRKSKPSPISVRDSAYNKGSSAKRRGSTSRGGATGHREHPAKDRIAGRPSPVPTKIAGDDGKVYEIDSIVDSRNNGEVEEFLVTWVGYPPTSSTWEPGQNLPMHLIDEFKEFSSSSRARRHVKPPPSDSE
ncbi:hypothetical protein FOL47_005150 [Perkinsus chesapeaki]|uniref:Chromo domain-containing protein n=1 Tax=Perkinsus chesapeaki TaxID=330153 RepID=A0A7J6LYK2_PERCH|nr:hypothetical protein FOL47_005150 [Perkinsus chesapeaki]